MALFSIAIAALLLIANLTLQAQAAGNVFIKEGDTMPPRNSNKPLQYEVGKLLGQGAFGKVFKGVDHTVHPPRNVAIKQTVNHKYYTEVAKIEERNLKLVKDAQAKHNLPNKSNTATIEWSFFSVLVVMHTAFLYYGFMTIVFEELGPSLLDFVPKQKYWTEAHVNELTYLLCTALSILHGTAHMIHTDIKPENILFADPDFKGNDDEYPNIRMIDFGISELPGRDTEVKQIASVWYRPPEAILNHPHSYLADMWSFGCTVLEVYTGLSPFRVNENDIVVHLAQIQAVLHDPKCPDYPIIPAHMRTGPPIFKANGELNITYTAYKKIRNEYKPLKSYLQQHRRGAMNDDLYDFLRRVLAIDPDCRMTVFDALEHPYLKYINGETTDINAHQLEKGHSPKRTTPKSFYPAKCYEPTCPSGVEGLKHRLKIPRLFNSISEKFQKFTNFLKS